MKNLSLAEELTLLAYDDDGVVRGTGGFLDYGLAGALLLELGLAGRIEVIGKKVVVIDDRPTGDDLVDAALRRITHVAAKPRNPQEWISRLSKEVRPAVLNRLVGAGVLRQERDKVLWVVPRTRYPAPDGTQPTVETRLRERMQMAVRETGPVDARTAAICGLANAVGLGRRLFPDLPKARVTRRLQEIGQGDWASGAVKKSIDSVQAAIIVLTVAAAVASSG